MYFKSICAIGQEPFRMYKSIFTKKQNLKLAEDLADCLRVCTWARV